MRILRFITWIIALSALIVMGCVVALFFLVNAQSVEKKMAETLSTVGLFVKTNEAPTVRVLPNINVTMPSARIVNEQNETVLFVRGAHFDISALWLPFGKVHINELALDGVSFTSENVPSLGQLLETYKTDSTSLFKDVKIANLSLTDSEVRLTQANRQLSLLNLRAKIAEPSPQMHGIVSVDAQAKIAPDNLLLDLQSAFVLDLDMSQGRIGLENFVAKGRGTREAEPFDFDITSPLVRLTNETTYASTAQVALTRDANIIKLNVAELNIIPNSWQAPDVHLNISTNVHLGKIELDLRSPLSVDHTKHSVSAQHLQGSIKLPGMKEPSPLSGHVSASLTEQKAMVEIFGRLHDAPMSFQGNVSGFDHPKIAGQLVMGRLRLQDLDILSVFSGEEGIVADALATSIGSTPTETTVATDVAPNIENSNAPEAQPTENRLENATQETTTEISQEASTQTASRQTTSIEVGATTETPVVTQNAATSSTLVSETENSAPEAPQADFGFLRTFDFEGSVVIGELYSKRLKLVQFKAPLSVKDNRLSLPAFTALAYDGRVHGEMYLEHSGLWSASFKGAGINLQRLVTDAGSTAATPGALNLQVNVKGEGFNLATLNGQVGFAASDTQIRGLDLDKALRDIERYREPQQGETLTTTITQLKGTASIANASATIDSVQLHFPGAIMQGQGQVDLINDTISGSLTGQSRRGLQTKLYVTGMWYKPLLTIQSEEIKRLNQIQAPTKPPKEDKPSSWDRIKGFFDKL